MRKHFTRFLRKCTVFGLFLTLMSVQQFYAQQVTGKVTDETNQGIPGVNILKKGTSTGVTTDFDGNYSIPAGANDELIFSFIGFKTKTVKVGTNKTLNVQLATDVASLDEVVVIGYGTARKSDLTGSVSQVSSKSFEDQPMARVEDALQGRAAGVTVQRNDGAPGGDIKIRVRGTNSITGNNAPLVVIDGIIGGNLSSLNPNDIASMDVLKDASATAIYGSRGANGVILISTKKGSGKSKLNVDFFTSVASVPKLLPTLGAADFARIENIRRGSTFIPESEISELERTGGTNYQKELFQTGISNNVQISYSGGDDKLNYFVSGNYVNQQGTVITTGYERYSLRSNVTSKINDQLKIGLNLNTNRASTINDIDNFGRYQGTLVNHAVTWDPTTPIYKDDGTFNERSSRELASLNYNPIARLRQSDMHFIQDRIEASANVSYDLTDNFNYTLVVGATTVNNTTENFVEDFGEPEANYSGATSKSHQVSNILSWNKSFGDHNLKATALYEFSGYESRFNGYGVTDLIGPLSFYFAELNKGFSINNNKVESSIESLMGRIEYNFNNKLFLTGTVRNDKSSRFQGDNKSGAFFSFAGSYSFNDMAFVKDSDVISSFKVRAGWGQVGNQEIGIYSTWDGVDIGGRYAFNGTSYVVGSSVGQIGNPDTTWETTTQTNVGIDVGLFNNRINLSLDTYKKNTTDLLLAVPIPATLVGPGKTIISNVGEVENRGFDIAIGADVIDGEDFKWNTNLSVSLIKNEVLSLFDGRTEIEGNYRSQDGQNRTWNIIQVGEPLGQFQGSTFLGTWKTAEATEAAKWGAKPGDAKYLLDENGNRVIQAIGNGTPTAMWGLNNSFEYKNWDMNLFFQGVHGFDVYNVFKGMIVGATGNQRSFLAPEQLNQWTAANETDIPASGPNDGGSTRYMEKGGFVRLSNLNIGYTFNDIKGFDSVKIYAGGQNLLLITDYSGYDPESSSKAADNSGNNDVAPGIDAGAYPNPRVFNIGVKFQL